MNNRTVDIRPIEAGKGFEFRLLAVDGMVPSALVATYHETGEVEIKPDLAEDDYIDSLKFLLKQVVALKKHINENIDMEA